MFTDSTAKHVYRSVATVFIIVHTTHGSVFVFLLLAVPFCCRLFCQWNYAYFFAAALNSLLCSIYLFHVAHSVSLNDVFLYFFFVLRLPFGKYDAPHKSHANLSQSHLQRHVWISVTVQRRLLLDVYYLTFACIWLMRTIILFIVAHDRAPIAYIRRNERYLELSIVAEVKLSGELFNSVYGTANVKSICYRTTIIA